MFLTIFKTLWNLSLVTIGFTIVLLYHFIPFIIFIVIFSPTDLGNDSFDSTVGRLVISGLSFYLMFNFGGEKLWGKLNDLIID